MKIKKSVTSALALALASTLVLTACSGAGSSDSPSGSEKPAGGDQADPVTLTVTTWRRDEAGIKDWYVEYVDAFESENPGVTVEVENIAFADYAATLTTRLTAGAGPSIIDIPQPTVTLPAWAAGGLLKPLNDYIEGTEIAELWPSTQEVFQWDGDTYGVLLVDYPFLLFYNEKMLDEAGVEAPTTTEDFLTAIEALTDGEKFGFAAVADNSNNFVREMLTFLTGMDATWATPGQWNWTDPAVVAGVDAWRTAAKNAPQGVDVNAKRQAFLDGNVAMIIDGPYYISAAKTNAGPDVAGHVRVASAPFSTVPGDVSLGFALPAEGDASSEDLAWKFIEGAASEKWQSRYAELTSSTVTRPGSSDVLLSDPDAAVAVEDKDAAVAVVPMNLQGLRANYAEFISIANPMFQKLVAGDAPTADVLAELQAELEAKDFMP